MLEQTFLHPFCSGVWDEEPNLVCMLQFARLLTTRFPLRAMEAHRFNVVAGRCMWP